MTPSLGQIPTVMTCKRALLGGVFPGVLATTTRDTQISTTPRSTRPTRGHERDVWPSR